MRIIGTFHYFWVTLDLHQLVLSEITGASSRYESFCAEASEVFHMYTKLNYSYTKLNTVLGKTVSK
jgi:hypothetical protein